MNESEGLRAFLIVSGIVLMGIAAIKLWFDSRG